MSYSHKFNSEKYSSISSVIAKIEEMVGGDRVVVKGLDRDQVGMIRYLLYDWLSHVGLKRMFRLRTEWDVGEIVIKHLGTPVGMEVEVKRAVKGLEKELEELILEDNPEDRVEQWIKEGKIELEEGEVLLERLKEILR